MKFSDLLAMCRKSLFSRKTRTALTVTGVVIGVCSILLMVSLGIGLNSAMTKQYSQWADLTMIEVYSNSTSSSSSSSSSSSDTKGKLNDDAVNYFKSLDHVKAVSPYMNIDSSVLSIKYGSKVYSGSVTAMDLTQLSSLGYKIDKGRTTLETDPENAVIAGKYAANAFTDPDSTVTSSDDQSYSDTSGSTTAEKTAFNIFTAPVRISAVKTASESSNSSTSSSASSVSIPIKLTNGSNVSVLQVVGTLTPEQAKDSNSYNGIYISIPFAKSILKQNAQLNKTKYSFSAYDGAKIRVDDYKNIDAVNKKLTDAGFTTYTAKSDLEQTKSSMKIIQLVLGALGGISLLVAAIGITNTMVMSIYERTHEIGVMKVLGCEIPDIRKMFLMEAAGIGAMGGAIGLVLSYLISAIVNHFASGFLSSDLGVAANISVIPWWLALAGILFAMLVGIISGYAPANRAVKISALTAIKQD